MKTHEISHFFLGRVSDHSKYNDFLEERYGEDDDTPLSKFCESQGEHFIDHDFMEIGARENEPSLEEFFKPYSYSEHWSNDVIEKANSLQLLDADVLLFVSKEEIKNPKSVKGKGFELVYIGEYGYPI